MTQEEKYKEALLEARAVLEPCLKYSKGKVREALDSIDKELKRFESEDERIKKTIRQLLETARDAHSNTSLAKPFIDALAWLEKQKEQKPKAKAKSPLSPHELYDAKIEGISQGRQDVLDHPEQFGLQKEQKVDIDKLRRDIYQSGYNDGYQHGKEDAQKEQKPEWSEEDEKMIKTIISVLERSSQVTTYEQRGGSISASVSYSDKYKEEIDWLKSLRPQYHGDVTMTEAYKMGLEAGKASSWKPSEEQMEALKRASTNEYLPAKQFDILVSLYEQLKKLM